MTTTEKEIRKRHVKVFTFGMLVSSLVFVACGNSSPSPGDRAKAEAWCNRKAKETADKLIFEKGMRPTVAEQANAHYDFVQACLKTQGY